MADGSIGRSGTGTDFNSPRSLNCTLAANEYPSGTITFTNIGSGAAYWRNQYSNSQSLTLYLCDSEGQNAVPLFTLNLSGGGTNTTTKTATVNAPGLVGKALYIKGSNTNGAILLQNQTGVTIQTASTSRNVTCSVPGGGGTLTASASSVTPGSTVTLYPSASTGYYLQSYTTSPHVVITNNQFTMPNSDITITATFAKRTYTITKAASPSGAGTVTTSKNSATMGESVTVQAGANTGYEFKEWQTSPNLGLSGANTSFTMPASNVSITAKYRRRSTGSLNKTSMTDGDAVTLTINSESTAYTHTYELSFGTGMTTGEISLAAGVNSATITIPDGANSWARQIPSQSSKSGTLTLKTYNDNNQVAETYTISGLTYNVPASAVPELGTITTSIARTIDGTTYANVGDYYVQKHCGVRVQGSATGSLGATITGMTVSLVGYTGADYSGSSPSGSIDFTSGMLTNAGLLTINVTATDSRQRTTTASTTVTVDAYSNPTGTLRVWRCDALGNQDDVGLYARFELTKNYTAIGSNTLTATLAESGGGSEVTALTQGDILPNSRKQFNQQKEYTITLTLEDSFHETAVITQMLPSARFVIYVSASGNQMGFMKAATHGGVNDDETIEFSDSATIYIGNKTLAEYIQDVVNNM